MKIAWWRNETRLKILALGIYGLMLLLLVKWMIDFEVINVFKSVFTLKIILVMIILTQKWERFVYDVACNCCLSR